MKSTLDIHQKTNIPAQQDPSLKRTCTLIYDIDNSNRYRIRDENNESYYKTVEYEPLDNLRIIHKNRYADIPLAVFTVHVAIFITTVSLLLADYLTIGIILSGILMMTGAASTYAIKKKKKEIEQNLPRHRTVEITEYAKKIVGEYCDLNKKYLKDTEGEYWDDHARNTAKKIKTQICEVLVRDDDQEILDYYEIITNIRSEYEQISSRRRKQIAEGRDLISEGNDLLHSCQTIKELEQNIYS